MATRIGIGALLLAALVAVFSLRALPRPLTADLPAEAYDGAAAARMNDALAARFPNRRAGSPGDAALADFVADEFRRAVPTAAIRKDEFDADTPDGTRSLINVSATLPGLPGPEILVVAHRDALRPGSAAELTATSALLALARAVGQNRFRHTVQFVSTTGASGGGLTGATRLARAVKGGVSAAIVLGDLSGDRSRPPQVASWANGTAAGSLRLQRTLETALRQENLRPSDSEALWRQLVRRGLPATVGEQGELNQAKVPSVILTSQGAVGSASSGVVDGSRFAAYGRAALRGLLAADEPSARIGPPQTGLIIADRELPGWALRVLLLCLLLPLTGGVLVLSISLARDGINLLAGLAWTLGCAVGPLIAGLVAIGAGRSGLVWPAVPAPFAGTALHTGAGAWVFVVVLLLVLVGSTVAARPFLTREIAGHHRPTRPAVAFGVFAVLLATIVALLVLDPLAAYLLVPALAAWPAAISPVPVSAPLHKLGLLLVGLLLPAAAAITVVSDLHVGITQLPWWLVLLVAGGHVTPVAMLFVSLVVGAAVATALSLVPPVRNPFTGRRGTLADDEEPIDPDPEEPWHPEHDGPWDDAEPWGTEPEPAPEEPADPIDDHRRRRERRREGRRPRRPVDRPPGSRTRRA
ncbi:hypothetical protein AB0L40_01955 [Patulibacter sp. NPDC049589]|uniref:hypothetical protein n=1 Tax=Patulibacter sp. NPDC049589 TaxID=3154731 RepID=UPI003449D691